MAPMRSRLEVIRVTICPEASRAITTRPLGRGSPPLIVGAFLLPAGAAAPRPPPLALSGAQPLLFAPERASGGQRSLLLAMRLPPALWAESSPGAWALAACGDG